MKVYIPKFDLYGFTCSETNTLYVIDVNGMHQYMPLDEAVACGEFEVEVSA